MLGFRVVTLPGGLLLAALVFLAGSPTASADTIVVPAPASAEGDTNNSHPFDLVDPFPLAYQQVYGSAEFGVEALWITGIAFRPDAETGRAFSATLPDVAIHLSTTAASPDNLSDILNDNRGVDEVLVRTGPLLLSSRYIGPTDGPKEFDIAIPFTTPFFYDPRRGNLLVFVVNAGGAQVSSFDAAFTIDGVSRAYNSGFGRPTEHDTLGLVTQFDASPVPEPASLTLVGLGLASLSARRIRRRT